MSIFNTNTAKIIAVIPAFNESGQIQKVLRKTINYVDSIIVVDDGSDENKFNYKKNNTIINSNIIYLRHRINLGKGAALKTGCEAAIKLGANIIIFMDADGQHMPEDIPRFIKKIEKNNLDIVFGSRKIGRDMPFMMMFGNKLLSIAVSLFFGIYISDTQSGFRALKASSYPKIKWNSDRYSVETEIIVNTAKYKLKYQEITIETIYHDNYKGTTIFDGIKLFFNILKWRIT